MAGDLVARVDDPYYWNKEFVRRVDLDASTVCTELGELEARRVVARVEGLVGDGRVTRPLPPVVFLHY